ncbi:MAG: 4Fe-4S dicluster domain-containing protein [Rikenellaceae bacterium]|nr:4Fe-4S dicluster domain-containing protein [Rikenellaceae bacterium]
MTRIDPKFGKKLKRYGAFDYDACYNCGTCTSVCSLAKKDEEFPREMVRYSSTGNQKEILSSLKPWLCYYCGECSTSCPRSANPGELMMSLRRWLTARYDWTGISGLLFTSLKATIIALLAVAAGVILFASFMNFDTEAIMKYGHYFEMAAISGVFAVILLPNLIRMWYFTIIQPGFKVPLKSYTVALKELFIHMFTQKRALGCDDNQKRWFEHFILVIGYLTLLFTTVFLDWFGTSSLPIIVTGYTVSAIVFIVTADFVSGRIKKSREVSRHSRPSDWLFVIWLLMMGLTAFIVRIAIDADFLKNNFWIYIIHLTILAQWALIIVPFGKWTHFLYRSFAIYFSKLTRK